ncbi:hypothetical protein DPMN_158078 [Dreissena polymorpha]|uniref:Uncharacterized protein n=1 Tax=Dreissena polymorpha TaxID=45954 RepID=A0A9D4EKP9_DREPO|nr:hypothetical protein DPMN_158078 [Dreissena polymorpha]
MYIPCTPVTTDHGDPGPRYIRQNNLDIFTDKIEDRAENAIKAAGAKRSDVDQTYYIRMCDVYEVPSPPCCALMHTHRLQKDKTCYERTGVNVTSVIIAA